MKKILLIFYILLFVAVALAYCQEDLCLTRGHVALKKDSVGKFAWCKPYIYDTDTISEIIYPSCAVYKYYCIRCGALILEVGKDRKRVTVWGSSN